MTSASSSDEAVVVRCGQAGRLADGAVDIRDDPARPADDVVVVVADPRLVASDGAGRLDAPHQTHGGQGVQHVVDGLAGHLGQTGAHGPENRLRVGVWMSVHRLQHRDPGRVTRRSAARSCSA